MVRRANSRLSAILIVIAEGENIVIRIVHLCRDGVTDSGFSKPNCFASCGDKTIAGH